MKLGESVCILLNNCFPKIKVVGRESPQLYSETRYDCGKESLALYAAHVRLKDKDILDAGCGFGGKTVYYAENGCNSIVGVDIDENLVEHSNQFAKKKGIFNAQFKIADLSSLPFESDTFDVVFLNDVVEHIRRPALTRVFEECRRVVKSDGRICLEFPPWSNWSAAHLYDYIYIPWCQFLFSDETLINVIRRMNPGHGFGRLSVIEHFKELNHVTVAEVMKISKKLDLKIIHSEMRMIKGKNYLKHIPLLNKYMVSRFVAVLAK